MADIGRPAPAPPSHRPPPTNDGEGPGTRALSAITSGRADQTFLIILLTTLFRASPGQI